MSYQADVPEFIGYNWYVSEGDTNNKNINSEHIFIFFGAEIGKVTF